MNSLKDKIYPVQRISPEEALSLFSWELIGLGRAVLRLSCNEIRL